MSLRGNLDYPTRRRLGANIRLRRRALGIARRQLALDLGVCLDTVANLESGFSTPERLHAAHEAIMRWQENCWAKTSQEKIVPPQGTAFPHRERSFQE